MSQGTGQWLSGRIWDMLEQGQRLIRGRCPHSGQSGTSLWGGPSRLSSWLGSGCCASRTQDRRTAGNCLCIPGAWHRASHTGGIGLQIRHMCWCSEVILGGSPTAGPRHRPKPWLCWHVGLSVALAVGMEDSGKES